jgi:hypothetical protein
MGFLDRLFGTAEPQQAPPPPRANGRTDGRAPQRSDDEIAVERYRYLLRTAPPETIEQVHREAFEQLTDEQRAMIYEELSRGAQTGERPLSSEPATLARAATRAEIRQPGTMERAFGGAGQQGQPGRQGPGFGSMIAGSLLGTVAGYVIGSALVSAFLPWDAGTDAAGAEGGDAGDAGGDAGADAGSVDASGADAGGWGGDFGGGDFGGDFGF